MLWMSSGARSSLSSFRAAEPEDCILDNLQDIRLLENVEGFVAGAEVEDRFLPDLPDAAGAESLAQVPLLLEDHRVRLGNVERLGIHLRLWDVERRRNPL